MIKPPLKLVRWMDAFNDDHDWVELKAVPEIQTPIIVSTVGFEIRRDDKYVVLCMSYHEAKESPVVCDLFTIPLAMIIDERVIPYSVVGGDTR